MSHQYSSEGYAAQYSPNNAQQNGLQGAPENAPQQEQQNTANPQMNGQPPQWGQMPPPMDPYQAQMYGYGHPPGAGHPHMQQPQMGHPHAHMNPYHGHPHMHPGFNHPNNQPQYHPHNQPQYHPHHAQHHPMWGHPQMMHGAYYPHPSMPPQPQPEASAEQDDPFMEQAQAMLEQALGEDAGMFKDILGSLGMNDKEFWKGAMVGAAAALLLSNDKVRGKLMDVVSGAGDMLKTGGGKVKETASQTASNVKENVTNSSEIFKETYNAGKEGFQASVERHYQAPAEEVAAETDESVQAEETAPVLSSTTQEDMKPA